MKCRQVRRWLSKYHDGHPFGREANRVATHLRGCAECRQQRGQMISLDSEVRERVGTRLEPASHVRHRVMERWLVERAAAAARGNGWYALLSAPRVAALCLLALTVAA